MKKENIVNAIKEELNLDESDESDDDDDDDDDNKCDEFYEENSEN